MDLRRTAAFADEGELLAVRREARLAIAGRVMGQAPRDAAGRRHGPDVAVPVEGEDGAIGRQGRVVGQADDFGGAAGTGDQHEDRHNQRKIGVLHGRYSDTRTRMRVRDDRALSPSGVEVASTFPVRARQP